MITDIIDFLPKYPDIIEKNFNMDIYTKKEFYDNKLEQYEEPPTEPGVLLRAQKIISRFLSSYTPYNGILLTWKMGVGKTGAAISVIEKIKAETTAFTGALIFAKGDTIIDNFKNEIVFKATKGDYIPDDYKELSPETQVTRKNKLLKTYYTFFTFETFIAKEISKMSNEAIIENYSNKIIVIDEVHNIRLQDIKNTKKKNKNKNNPLLLYQNFHRFLHTVKNCKIILLSGTPIKDSIDEIASVMNLILPIDEQLPTDKEFINTFFDKEETFYKIKPDKEVELKNKFTGRVSYLEATRSSVKKEYVGEKIGFLNHFIVYPDYMSEHQAEHYKKAYEKDNKRSEKFEFVYDDDEEEEEDIEVDYQTETSGEEGEGDIEFEYEEDGAGGDDEDKSASFSINSRQASLFVFPDGSYGKNGFKNKNYIKEETVKKIGGGKNKSIITYKLDDKFKKQCNTIEKLRKFVCVFASLIIVIL